MERGILIEELVVDLHGEISRDDRGFLSGSLPDNLKSELMEGPALEILLPEPLGKGFCGLAREGDQQDLGRVHFLDIDQVTDLSDRGHCLAASSAADDKDIIFQRDDRLPLLGIKRMGEYRIEIWCVVLQLLLDERLIVDLLEPFAVRQSLVEALDKAFLRMPFQFFRANDLVHLRQKIGVLLIQTDPFRLRDVVAIAVE